MLKLLPKKRPDQPLMRQIRFIVLICVAVFLPLYMAIRFTGGSTEKLKDLPELLDRVKRPLVWEVPEGGVQYLNFFHGEPSEGQKFVLVRVRMKARMKIGYPVVPKCFKLVDDKDRRYFPFSRSPLFIERSDEFYMDRDDAFEGELLFEIPLEREAVRLLFDRYRE